MSLTQFKEYRQGNAMIVEPMYKGENQCSVKWAFESGQLPKLEYAYSLKGDADFMDITF